MKQGLIPKAAALLLAIALTAPAAAADEALLLGYAMAKTGPFVSLANSNEVAADMAVEEINAAGGVNGHRIRLVKFDTAGNPRQAVVAVRKFAQDDKALAVIGPFSSSEAKVAFPAGERLGIPMMSMASSAPNLARPFKFAFRNTTDELTVISLVLKTIRDKGLPAASAAIAYATDDTVSKIIGTRVLPKILEQAGYTPKEVVTFKYAAFDLSPQVSRLAQTPVDLIGLGAPPEASIKLAKEMKRQGVTGRIFGGTTVADVELPRRMDGAGEGMTIGTTFYRDVSDRTRAFAEAFAERARAAGLKRLEPNQFDAATYDIVHLYAAAMQAAGTTGDPAKVAEERAAIVEALNGLKDFPALEGAISFGANGDALKPIYVLEIRDGAWSLLGTQAR